MSEQKTDNRVSYDKFWGGLLLVTCVMPYRLGGESYPWQLFQQTDDIMVKVWLAAGSAAALFAVVAGLAGWRGRTRHLLNFLLAGATLALPVFAHAIWTAYPEANPASLPLGELGSVGWVMLLALIAIYAGSGIRIARPTQIAGQALGALGAMLLAVFAFLPMEGQEQSFAYMRIARMPQFATEWRELVPFCLLGLAAVCGTVNLLRTRAEVELAKVTRLLIVAGLLFWVTLPFLENTQADGGTLERHLPTAWGGLRVIAPLFLALDGCIAFLAISITRSSE